MAKKISKIAGYLVTIFLLIYILISTLIPNQTINIFGFKTFVVLSSSMEPKIKINDMIVVTKTNEEKLKVRDIITFEVYLPETGQRSFVTHYIADIQQTGDGNTIYKTQGFGFGDGEYDNWKDENNQPYDIVQDDIIGKYQFHIPKVGVLINGLRDPIFVVILIINSGVIYGVYHYVTKLIKDDKESKKEMD